MITKSSNGQTKQVCAASKKVLQVVTLILPHKVGQQFSSLYHRWGGGEWTEAEPHCVLKRGRTWRLLKVRECFPLYLRTALALECGIGLCPETLAAPCSWTPSKLWHLASINQGFPILSCTNIRLRTKLSQSVTKKLFSMVATLLWNSFLVEWRLLPLLAFQRDLKTYFSLPCPSKYVWFLFIL